MKYLLSLALAISCAYASSAPLTSWLPTDWLGRIVNTEEHLIHREEVGPYLVSGDGQRLIGNPYLKLDIRSEGERIPPSSDVQVDATLQYQGEVHRTRYTPEARDGLFVIDPLELPGAETWGWESGGWLELDLLIDGPAGEGQGGTGFYIYPPKPETSRVFSVINFGLPFALLVLVALIYRLRRVRLQRYGAS